MPDAFLIALATLGVLADAAARSPLLVIAEDAQWLDRPDAPRLALTDARATADGVAFTLTQDIAAAPPYDLLLPVEIVTAAGRAYDERAWRRLWEVSEELTGVSYDFTATPVQA